MRFAYYLPPKKKGQEGTYHGDEELRDGLKEIYHSYGITYPTMTDGCSRFDVIHPDGRTEIRTIVVLRNLFPKNENKSEHPCVLEVSVEEVERRTSFSRLSPGVGDRKTDI